MVEKGFEAALERTSEICRTLTTVDQIARTDQGSQTLCSQGSATHARVNTAMGHGGVSTRSSGAEIFQLDIVSPRDTIHDEICEGRSNGGARSNLLYSLATFEIRSRGVDDDGNVCPSL